MQAEGGEELKAASLEASNHSHHVGQSRLHGCVTRAVVPGPTFRRALYLAQCSAALILTILIIFKNLAAKLYFLFPPSPTPSINTLYMFVYVVEKPSILASLHQLY